MKRFTSVPARAFTLIEVLVVVAIIALLVSILIPALNRARDQARQAACAAHMHQVMLAIHVYAGENQGLGPQRGWKTYTVSEWPSEINGWGGQNSKILCNIGQLYKKYIGGQEDVLYCPSLMRDLKYFPYTPGGGSPGSGSGWASLWDASYTYTFGSYNYGPPLATKGNKSPSKSPNFRGPHPYPRETWSGAMDDGSPSSNTLVNWWLQNHPGMTRSDFRIPVAPGLLFGFYFGGRKPPHSMGTRINVLYTDGHVRAHRQVGDVSSQGVELLKIWFDLSIKQ